jgi:disulfide oxidoreductase YuzD
MAYNRKNFLLTVLDVQEIVLEKQKLGITNKRIYRDYIYPNYRISKRTFDEYLGIPAKKQLKEIENENKNKIDPNQISMLDTDDFERPIN